MAKSESAARLLERGTLVLGIVGRSTSPLSFTEIQQHSELPKATLFRILTTLRKQGFLRLDLTGKGYVLGDAMLDILTDARFQVVNHLSVTREMQRLADAMEKPVLHWRLEGDLVRLTHHVLPFGLKAPPPAFETRLLAESACGLSILAAMPPVQLANALTKVDGTCSRQMPHRLGISAATGFSILSVNNDGLGQQDEYEIAAAITDTNGTPVAALATQCIGSATSEADRHQLGRQLAYAAQKVSVGPNSGPRKNDVQRPSPKSANNVDQKINVWWHVDADDVGTSPYWDARQKALVWVDSLGGALTRVGTDDLPMRRSYGGLPGAAVAAEGGRTLVASREGVFITDIRSDRRVSLSHPEPEDTLRRFSVAKTGPNGQVWLASLRPLLAEGFGAGRLYAFRPDGRIEKMAELERGAKGLCWSVDGAFMYVTEAGSKTLLRYECDPDTGRPTNPRRFARYEGPGTPNGIATDTGGGVWAAIYGGWQVVRFDRHGQQTHAIELPVPLPTGLCFFGPRLSQLFVTTCRMHVPPEVLSDAPASGHPLVIDTSYTGCPSSEFRML